MTTLDQVFDFIDRVDRKNDEKLIIYGEDSTGDGIVGKTELSEESDDQDNDLYQYKNTIAYEAAVYTQVINPMMADRECANLVTSAAWMEDVPYKEWADQVERINTSAAATPTLEDFLLDVDSIDDTQGTPPLLSTLVTVVPPDFVGTVWDVFSELVNDWRVPFQMAYTLTACQMAGLSHNDNHLSNWLVSRRKGSDGEAKDDVYYAVSETAFVPVSDLRIWLFDWDLAYARQLGPNPGLGDNLCSEYGMCNDVNSLHDLALMACSLDIGVDEDTCSNPGRSTPNGMWADLKTAVCNRGLTDDTPCHISESLITMPQGAETALQYVLQDEEIQANVVSIDSLDASVVQSLKDGRLMWVAHRGIDREALLANLQSFSRRGRKRPFESVAIEDMGERADLFGGEGDVIVDPSMGTVEVMLNLPW